MLRLRLVLAAGALLLVGAAAFADFSADLTHRVGSTTMTGKFYVKGTKTRFEATMKGQPSITINRMDKQLAWALFPTAKTYMEMRSAGMAMFDALGDPMRLRGAKGIAGVKQVGSEMVSGYRCDKYAVTFTDKARGTQYAWVSKKLGYPLKIEWKNARFSMFRQCTNIRERALPDTMFEIPAGYRKMERPTMPMGQRPAPSPQGRGK